MAYTKPQVIAQNASTGSYATGCPAGIGGRVHSVIIAKDICNFFFTNKSQFFKFYAIA